MSKEPTLEELAIAFDWNWATENMRQDAQLRYFISWAKYQLPLSSHAPIDAEVLDCVINGVERHLNGKAPWVKKTGNKEKREEMWEAYFLCSFEKEFPEALQHKRHRGIDGIYTLVGNKLNKSPSAIESLDSKAKKVAKTPNGKNEFLLWFLSSSYNTKGWNRANFMLGSKVSD